MLNKKQIAVLGAGPMGLAVAYQLILDGYKPILFEADDRIGGMTASFDFNGIKIERFYHFHCTSDKAFIKILSDLNIEHKLHWKETKMGYWYLNKLQNWGNPIALIKFEGLSLLSKLRYGLHAFFSTKKKNWKNLDNISAKDWIIKWVGKEAYKILWEKLFDYKFYHYGDSISAAWIWSRIRRLGNSRYSLFREKLGYLEGGSETLLNALERKIIDNGGVIHLSTQVKEVKLEKDHVVGVQTDKEFHKFDQVISTIPLPYVPTIIPQLPINIIKKYQSIKNIAVVCVIAKLSKKISENFWVNINDPEMDIPGFVEYSNLRPLKNSIVYVPFYMPGDHPYYAKENEYFIEKVKSYFKKINSDIHEKSFIDIKASRYRYAQPICDINFLNKLPPIDLKTKGLCIADTSYYYPEDRGISESVELGINIAKRIKLD